MAADQDYLLAYGRGSTREASTSRTEEDNDDEGFQPHYIVLVCIALLGVLATVALAAGTLGYEVGLNVPSPKMQWQVVEAHRRREPGSAWGAEAQGELPGPSVQEFSAGTIRGEDAEWESLELSWREEEARWRRAHAVNKTVFYMYRAQSSKEYPPLNVNMADLSGVLWYLHHEIVGMTPRKYSVARILRYKVTVKNTEVLHRSVHADFGPFVAFDSGRCTVPTCDQIWQRYGFVVGCQVLRAVGAKYSRQMPCDSAHCSGGIWYSLPGPCPAMEFSDKSPDCERGMPGGMCRSANVTGEASCTYHAEEAGFVDLDEFSFIRNYSRFVDEGRREYDPLTDTGVGFTFWDGIDDQERCVWRMNRLQLLFKKKFPSLPAFLDPPPCPR